MKKAIFSHLYKYMAALLIIAFLLSAVTLYSVRIGEIEDDLANTLHSVTDSYNSGGIDEVADISFYCLTIDSGGEVTTFGTCSQREIKTLEQSTLFADAEGSYVDIGLSSSTVVSYGALAQDGAELRLYSSTGGFFSSVLSLVWVALICGAIMLYLCTALSEKLSVDILSPINEINLESPLESTAHDEFAPLLRRLEKQRRQVERQKSELEMRRLEFDAVTNCMNEGLVVLSSKGTVLSCNRAALKIFTAKEQDVTEHHILSLSRAPQVIELSEGLAKGVAGSARYEDSGRIYSMRATPTMAGGGVLLILDITESAASERMRKEFSANVSHELKTPLTVISGYAELITSGMAKPSDFVGFAGKIYEESARLLRLIEDIISISRLDEGMELPRENVNILPLVRDIAGRFNGVEIVGTDWEIFGVRHILSEMIYNLIDNAFKYNKPNGSVKVTVGDHFFEVADTGIGIPQEDRERVFERFFRVDKSRSKNKGGTGLGLSIVKHGAAMHEGIITLDTSDEGTTIRITF